jgi:hypothetical protein
MATSYLQQFAAEMKTLGNTVLHLDLASGLLVYAALDGGTLTTIHARDHRGRLIIDSRTVVSIAA